VGHRKRSLFKFVVGHNLIHQSDPFSLRSVEQRLAHGIEFLWSIERNGGDAFADSVEKRREGGFGHDGKIASELQGERNV
jgi:hypothetical protein